MKLSYPETKPNKDYTSKDSYRSMSYEYISSKKILVNQIQHHKYRIIHHKQLGFILEIQGSFCIWKLNNAQFDRIKDKIQMIISLEAEKGLCQMPTFSS